MILNRTNDVVWINHIYITRIEESPRSQCECRIYMMDGKVFDSNTEIKILLDLIIKAAQGEK